MVAVMNPIPCPLICGALILQNHRLGRHLNLKIRKQIQGDSERHTGLSPSMILSSKRFTPGTPKRHACYNTGVTLPETVPCLVPNLTKPRLPELYRSELQVVTDHFAFDQAGAIFDVES